MEVSHCPMRNLQLSFFIFNRNTISCHIEFLYFPFEQRFQDLTFENNIKPCNIIQAIFTVYDIHTFIGHLQPSIPDSRSGAAHMTSGFEIDAALNIAIFDGRHIAMVASVDYGIVVDVQGYQVV